MKNIDEIRRNRLEDLVNETTSKSLEEVAEMAGTSSAYLSQIRNQLPDSVTGNPKKMGDRVAEKLRAAFKKPKGWMDTDHAAGSEEPESTDYTIEQYHDVHGGMGNGLVLRDQPGQITGWRVTPEWINKNVPNNTGRNNLSIVTGFGDSMRGMFNSGDPLLVDTGVRSLEFDAVYFFRIGDEGFIKTLQRIPGDGIRVISENKKYESWTITSDMDFEVFGRVLKVWKSEDF